MEESKIQNLSKDKTQTTVTNALVFIGEDTQRFSLITKCNEKDNGGLFSYSTLTIPGGDYDDEDVIVLLDTISKLITENKDEDPELFNKYESLCKKLCKELMSNDVNADVVYGIKYGVDGRLKEYPEPVDGGDEE